MRYKSDHKPEVRQRILDEAGRLFRKRGYDGVGIDAIMAAAGLTRGGFYGHFASKDDLFAEVLRGDHDFVTRLAARRGKTRTALAREGREIVRAYLAPENRERVARGCTMSSLGIDAVRAGRTGRAAFGDGVRALAEELARGLKDPAPGDPRALVTVALCIGGLLLSRAVADPAQADAISEACRNAAENALTH